jgi:hypothetical protein
MTAVPKIWEGETAVCIASGPSLTPDDVNAVKGKARVIAINASYVLAPWADVIYCADMKPFKWYWDKGPKGHESVRMRDCQGLKYSLTSTARAYAGVKLLRRGPLEGLSLNPTILHTGHNSGYQAINLAVLMGVKRIVLLGYDMQQSAGQEHWHVDHPNVSRSPYQKFRACFATLVQPLNDAGVDVINCSRRTALTCFPQMPLEQALPMREVAA